MLCYLYHICRVSDKLDFTKGYIGVSSNPNYRWERHKKYESKNTPLRRAYNKYDDLVEYLVLAGTRDYCLERERALRPTPRLGWNTVEGGGMPPSHKGKQMSDSQKSNIGKANSGTNSYGWKGWWVIDGERYTTTKEASIKFNITRKTVRDRVANPLFPNWVFEPKEKR